jgi:cold shock CspA family protein
MSQIALVKGTITYVNSDSGCGFITTERVEKDVLFLRNRVHGFVPEVGLEVTCEIAWTKNGPRAMNVQRM